MEPAGGMIMVFLKWVKAINNIVGKIAGGMLAAMTISIVIQVLSRMIISKIDIQLNVAWTEEVARYLMIWMVFLGGALAALKGRMIAIETLAQLLPAIAGQILKYTAHIISITFYIVIFFIGWDWVKFGISETAPVTRISMSIVYSSMLVGALFMTINTIAFIVENAVYKKDIRFADLEEETITE
jgi:TRAP-type C4-dicarboxylate transport system permease small subunit